MRFAIELDFPKSDLTQNQMGEVLAIALEQGFKQLGHASGVTVDWSLEKMRARSIDLDKPVEQQE